MIAKRASPTIFQAVLAQLDASASVVGLSHASLDWYRPAWVKVTSNRSTVVVVRRREKRVLTRLTAQFAMPLCHHPIKRASARSASDTMILHVH